MKRQAVKRPAWYLRARRARAVFMADRFPYWRDTLDAAVFLAFMGFIAYLVYIGGGCP